MSIVIRTATPQDAECACKVLCRSIAECCIDDHQNDEAILAAWLSNKTPENVSAWIQSPANFSVVAVSDDQVIGMAMVTRQGRIVLCYVTPEKRYTGAGKAMLQALEAQVKEWGLRALQVQSTVTATPFYMRNGYLPGGSARSAYGADVISLSKRLTAGSYARKAACGCGK